MHVVGVDGCPGGWVAVTSDTTAGSRDPRVHQSFAALLAAYPAGACIAVDTPIGLNEGEPRQCDIAARRLLGPRRASVFPAPDPRVLDAATYQEALERSRPLTGKGISVQSFGIYPKVAEVNRTMTARLHDRVVEVHPEVSCWALAGHQPLAFSKRTPDGFAERRNGLAARLNTPIWSREDARRVAPPATCSTRSWPPGPSGGAPRARPSAFRLIRRSMPGDGGWRSSINGSMSTRF